MLVLTVKVNLLVPQLASKLQGSFGYKLWQSLVQVQQQQHHVS